MPTNTHKDALPLWPHDLALEARLTVSMSGNTVTDSEINIVQQLNQPAEIARIELSDAEPIAGHQSASCGLIFYRHNPHRDIDLRPYVVIVGSAADRFLSTGLQ